MGKIDFRTALNPEQYAAVTHGAGPQLVLAGAGSGKTRVITYRIAWLIEERGVDPQAIVALTFTNKAAQEMKERVEGLLGLYPLRTFVGTFHRFALRLLRVYGERIGLPRGFAIFDASDQKNLVKRALEAEGLSLDAFQPQAVLAAISGAKNRLLDPADFEREADDFFRRRIVPVYRRYQKLLTQAGAVDFDDMLALSVRLLREDAELSGRLRRRHRHVLIDEFQDTNHVQLCLIHELVESGGNLTAVGDEDQGIYRWRGAELANILRFEDSFPGAVVRKLERNYRSTQRILDAAGAVVEHNENRRGKRLWTEAGDGDSLMLYRARDEQDEARWVVQVLRGLEPESRRGESAILVRTNAQTRSFEDELMRQRVPYSLVGGVRFYERAEIKDLVAYLRFLRNPLDVFSFNRILNTPPRGIGKRTHEALLRHAEALDRPVWEVLVAGDFGDLPARSVRALESFRKLMQDLMRLAAELPLPALLRQLLEATSYTSLYEKKDAESQAKLENVQEFLSAAQEFTESQAYGSDGEDVLTAFLDHVALVSDVDELAPGKGLALLTLHSAKGLEFESVVVAGLEEGLLPHFNSRAHPDDLEEERRLLYVGMTRAEKRLFLTTCRRRRISGLYRDQEPSRFLVEIPERLLTVEESPELFDRGYGGYDRGSYERGGYERSPPARPRSGSEAGNVYAFFGRQPPAIAAEPEAPRTLEPLRERRVVPVEDESGGGRTLSFRRGARVRHATLGEGSILTIEGSGDDQRLVIYFDRVGRRKVIAKYARLELV